MNEIKWVKLSVNMFNDEKIKLIKTMPEGDKIIVIWVQLLCLAGKTNDGGLVYMGQNMAYTDEMLATLFDENVNVIRIALQTLEQFGMIELRNDGKIDILNWEKHQSTDKMSRMKEQARIRQQKHYYRNKLREIGFEVDAEGFTDDLEELKRMYEDNEKPNVRLTLANDTEVRSKKKEERSKKKEVRKDILSRELDDVPYSDIIDHLNKKAVKQYKHTTAKTKTLIQARWNEGFRTDDFKKVIDTKVSDWKDNDMSKYLRPETLFGTKFEGYLNENRGDDSESEYDHFF